MKQIKAMLACIAVVAIIGGVFAFKAKSAYTTLIGYTTGTTFNTSYYSTALATITAGQPATITSRIYTTPVFYTTGLPVTSFFSTKQYLIGGQ